MEPNSRVSGLADRQTPPRRRANAAPKRARQAGGVAARPYVPEVRRVGPSWSDVSMIRRALVLAVVLPWRVRDANAQSTEGQQSQTSPPGAQAPAAQPPEAQQPGAPPPEAQQPGAPPPEGAARQKRRSPEQSPKRSRMDRREPGLVGRGFKQLARQTWRGSAVSSDPAGAACGGAQSSISPSYRRAASVSS